MILILFAEAGENQPISPSCWESLDAAERSRALQISNSQERKRFVMARYLLRLALSQVLNQNISTFSFYSDKNGKPHLLNPQNTALHHGRLDFSISHSTSAVAAAVSTEGRIGLDLELFQNIRIEEIAVAFSPEELEKIAALNTIEQGKICIQTWSEKEAAAKLLGCPVQLDITSLPHVQSGDNYALKSWTLDFGLENYQLCLAYDGSVKTEIILRKETA